MKYLEVNSAHICKSLFQPSRLSVGVSMLMLESVSEFSVSSPYFALIALFSALLSKVNPSYL